MREGDGFDPPLLDGELLSAPLDDADVGVARPFERGDVQGPLRDVLGVRQ
jgi:hypothetical protein